MNFLLTETRATHLVFCCISQFALRSRRTSWQYQTPTLEYIQIDEKEEFLLKVKCRPLNKHIVVFSVKKIPLFFKTSVCLITFAKQFLRSAFMKKKKTLLAIEK